MRDISNKLHALVDEFVSNLSSECDSLAHNVSAQARIYVEHDSATEATQGPRPNNRTASEVLHGLKRPSASQVVDLNHREGKSSTDHAKPNFQDRNSRGRDSSRPSRHMKDMKPGSAYLEESTRHADSVFDDMLLIDDDNIGRGMNAQAGKGKIPQTYELLSSDHSSDDTLKPTAKISKKVLGKHRVAKLRDSSSQCKSIRIGIESPSRSIESSHVMNYSYEEDTKSVGGKSQEVDNTFPKLKWPKEPGDSHEDGGSGSDKDNNAIHRNEEPQWKNKTAEVDDDINIQEDDEFDDDDLGRNPVEAQSEGEELPVLPKVPVKRKLLSEPKSSEKRSQRGRSTSKSPQLKKYKTPMIDASVITQLEFGKRPQNSVSKPPLHLAVSRIMLLKYVLIFEVDQQSPSMSC